MFVQGSSSPPEMLGGPTDASLLWEKNKNLRPTSLHVDDAGDCRLEALDWTQVWNAEVWKIAGEHSTQ